jgi:hypothetical protein
MMQRAPRACKRLDCEPVLTEKSRDDDKLPPSRCVRVLLPPPSKAAAEPAGAVNLITKRNAAFRAGKIPLLAIVAATLRWVEEGGDMREDDAAEEE